MSNTFRSLVPQFMIGFVGVLISVELFVSMPVLSDVVKQLILWATIMVNFALILGAYNILGFHYRQVTKKKTGEWYFSIYTIAMLIFATAVGLFMGINSQLYTFFWFNLSGWLYMCSLGIQGLFMISGAYRAMRVRSSEASLFLVAAVIVILAQIPLAGTFWPWIIPGGNWLVAFPVTGANTGMAIGIGIGVVALGARTLYGREKTARVEAET